MNNSTRLIKTISGLAVSMTLTTVLLGWLNPASSIGDEPLTHDDLQSLADSLVHDGVEITDGWWNDVRVQSVPPARNSGAALAATTHKEDHFVVDPLGFPTRTHRWRRQLVSDSAPHTILIKVALVEGRSEPSSTQSAAVDALVNALQNSSGTTDVNMRSASSGSPFRNARADATRL